MAVFGNDTGVSGRKIIADTYCGLAPHGGGALSGKDPSKVDRSATYMTRFVAKNVVANGLAKSCLIAVAYAFGEEVPVMLSVETNDSTRDSLVAEVVRQRFDFRPRAIIERLNLNKARYLPTATYGHFTESEYSWEGLVSI